MNKTKLQFDFGFGLVAAHQHINPDKSIGGWVANTATVEATCYISGDARVYGNARLYGDAQVHGDAQVSGDAWEKSPLYIQGTKHAVTNCAFGKISIGCHIHTFIEWIENYKRIGKDNGYTDEEIKEYKAIINFVIKHGRKQ